MIKKKYEYQTYSEKENFTAILEFAKEMSVGKLNEVELSSSPKSFYLKKKDNYYVLYFEKSIILKIKDWIILDHPDNGIQAILSLI